MNAAFVQAALDSVPSVPALPTWSPYAAVAVAGIAGATHAARRGFDVIGVLGLALASGVGGLLLRDVLLQKGTPVVLSDPRYLAAAAAAAVVGFFASGAIARLSKVLLALDALAMGLFVSLGATAAFYYRLGLGAAIFLGLTTAITGSVLRDVLSGEPPAILRPGIISGIAALLGAVVFAVLYEAGLAITLNQVITVAVVFAVRVLAVWRQWESPPSAHVTERISDFWDRAQSQLPGRGAAPGAVATGAPSGSGPAEPDVEPGTDPPLPPEPDIAPAARRAEPPPTDEADEPPHEESPDAPDAPSTPGGTGR